VGRKTSLRTQRSNARDRFQKGFWYATPLILIPDGRNRWRGQTSSVNSTST
jgi:hypothetical protein